MAEVNWGSRRVRKPWPFPGRRRLVRVILGWLTFLVVTSLGGAQAPGGQTPAGQTSNEPGQRQNTPRRAAANQAARENAAQAAAGQGGQAVVGPNGIRIPGALAPNQAPAGQGIGGIVGAPAPSTPGFTTAGGVRPGALAPSVVVNPVNPYPTHQARVKDISTIEGIRDNQLVGYGLVVGLAGTGDSQQTTFPTQTLASMLLRMGVSVLASAIRVQNLAAVFVAATLPPFARPGTKLDLTVSSAGDAKSLDGGLLLMTPLYGADGKIYAQAQGSLVLGGYSVTSNGSSRQLNHPTTARIPFGAITERAIPLDLAGRDRFSILLDDADFKSAEAMADAVNRDLGRPLARVIDSRRVELALAAGEDVPLLLSRVEAVEVPQFPRAKVIVNERTGTVVIGGTVVLQPVSILHGGLAINVVTEFVVSQPGPFSNGTTQVIPQSQIDAKDKPVSKIELKQGSTVDDLVRSLQTIGASAHDVISILQAMKAAGALEAEIEVL